MVLFFFGLVFFAADAFAIGPAHLSELKKSIGQYDSLVVKTEGKKRGYVGKLWALARVKNPAALYGLPLQEIMDSINDHLPIEIRQCDGNWGMTIGKVKYDKKSLGSDMAEYCEMLYDVEYECDRMDRGLDRLEDRKAVRKLVNEYFQAVQGLRGSTFATLLKIAHAFNQEKIREQRTSRRQLRYQEEVSPQQDGGMSSTCYDVKHPPNKAGLWSRMIKKTKRHVASGYLPVAIKSCFRPDNRGGDAISRIKSCYDRLGKEPVSYRPVKKPRGSWTGGK